MVVVSRDISLEIAQIADTIIPNGPDIDRIVSLADGITGEITEIKQIGRVKNEFF